MQIEELKQNRYVRNFFKDRWLILGSSAVVIFFSLLYLAFLFQPNYKSEAQVWIKDTSSSYLAGGEGGGDPSYLRPLTTSGNPVMTQTQLLTSHEMEDFLADYVLENDPKSRRKGPDGQWIKPDTEKIIKVKTEPNSDVMHVSLNWHDPVMAKNMLAAALERFDETNLNINRKIYTKKRDYLDQQLTDIQGKLNTVRGRIKDYQSGSMAVDVDSQTQELVRLRSQLVAQLEAVSAARSNSATNASALQGQLRMSPSAALTAVALGSGNENLVKMRSDLAVLKQQYAHDSVKEAPTNPHLVALKQQIDAIQSQIDQEVVQTTGRSGGKGQRIYDSVRSQLVQDLASSRARAAGLSSEAASLNAAIVRVDSALREIPKSRYALASLQEEEKSLSAAYDELSKKAIDARIREAETPSNIFVVDAPTVPKKESFPAGKHVFVLSALLGLMAGLGLSALRTYSEDLAEGAESVEEATRGKVLGVIPWLLRPLSASGDNNVVSINELAYKNIISNLRLESARNEADVIAFTSSAMDKPQLSTAYSLAQRLTRMGQTVALIDADFRPSALYNYIEDPGAASELSDVILSIDLKLRKGQPVYAEEVLSGMMADTNGVYLALNRHDVDHAYDYFASKGFRHMVNVLKEHFDWVFIDTPSAMIAPEFQAVSQVSDGVVLFADRKATFNTLRRVSRKIREQQVPLIGTVIRENNVQLEREHEEYTRWRNSWKNGGGHGGPGGGTAVATQTAGSAALASRKVEFMGARIDALTMRETLDRIVGLIDSGEKAQHVVVNVAKLMTMQHDARLREIVNSSAIVNADGAGVVMGAKLLGIDIPERVAGIDLMQELVDTANKKGYRVFFLGAEEDVVRDVVTIYKRRFPGLQICGYRNGYFKPQDEFAVARQIREARPDILFVAMSSPKKERFIREHLDTMNVPFVMGVGGSFDVVAGKLKRAPRWMQDSGLEWFYRLAQEPGRMWKRYLVTNTQYGLALANRLVSGKMRPANG